MASKKNMITCKFCGNEIPENSIFCMYCGSQMIKKVTKEKEISVPTPILLSSGTWNIQLRKENVSITEKSRDECIAKAKAIRAGFIEKEKKRPKEQIVTLERAIRKYIDNNSMVLDPSTIRGYEIMSRTRFKNYQKMDIAAIDYQKMLNEETKIVAPKTVNNGWGLVTAALGAINFNVPKVNKPKVPKKDLDFLDYQQIQIFLKACKGDRAELPMLLGLHSLRISEIQALTPESLKKKTILVRGAVVRNKDDIYVKKETNKTDLSTRDIPVMIPRLLEIWPKEGDILSCSRTCLNDHIERICRENNLTVCTIHDLRRSFASLAYHLRWSEMTTQKVGGWADRDTVQKIYEKLSELDKNEDIRRMKVFYGMEKPRIKKITLQKKLLKVKKGA